MAFCDYCTCDDCRTGIIHVLGEPACYGSILLHAPTEFGDFICDVCWQFKEPFAWQHACGAELSYSEDGYCPAIVGEWRTLAEERTLLFFCS